MTFVIDILWKTLNIFVAVVGGHVRTRNLNATKRNLPLVVCASHRLNLAVKDTQSDHERVLLKFNTPW